MIRDKKIQVRLTGLEKKKLDEIAKALNIPTVDYVRISSLNVLELLGKFNIESKLFDKKEA